MSTKIKYLPKEKEPKMRTIAIALSIVLPFAVAILFLVKIPGIDLSFLPSIYAGINAVTAVVLIAALIAVKNKNIKLHKTLINVAILLSLAFLLMYVAYHMTSDSTPYGGEGVMRYIYFFVLITHIFLSVIITPLVCFTYLKGWLGDVENHKKLTRYTFPLWLYVAVSGVVVYLMISPYYN